MDTYFEIAPVSLQSQSGIFSHKYNQNTMNITYAKIKKNITEPIFQTSTSSGLFKWKFLEMYKNEQILHIHYLGFMN